LERGKIKKRGVTPLERPGKSQAKGKSILIPLFKGGEHERGVSPSQNISPSPNRKLTGNAFLSLERGIQGVRKRKPNHE